jgi:TolB-like protein
MAARVAHYRIEEPLGEGGMGEVWAAQDLRLGRRVALKRVRTGVVDDRTRRRLWREARAAAAVNHPHVCQVHDLVEEGDELFLAMELLEGESLARRLTRGRMAPHEAIPVMREILRALAAVHDADLVHRDLKPANVMLTSHGVKLLDFGLTRRPPGEPDGDTGITRPGEAMGTPRYMSPEQWAGEGIGPRSDLFAAGALLYEMLAGRPAIEGETIREVMENALGGKREPLGTEEIGPYGPVIERALDPDPAHRFASAHEMLEELEDVADRPGEREQAVPDGYTRLAVLPFRLLRPDPEIEFLAHSLPDALVTSLAASPSMVVCTASGAVDEVSDLTAIARRSRCDAVLHGSILRAGEQVRVTTQLVEAPSGNVLRAQTSQGTLEDIFRLQDDIVREIIQSLAPETEGAGPVSPERNRPASGRAYELYLRANELASRRRTLPEACALYRECLELDPHWAPAWARLGRAQRVLAKYSQSGSATGNLESARESFRRALALDPDLSVAHNLVTFLEVEELGRSRDAMVRLLERAHTRANDPQLFAGLVLACRFCGLLDASVAADRRARHLDPGVRTSVHYTYLNMCEWQKAIEYDDEDMKYVTRQALLTLGRAEDARRIIDDADPEALPGLERHLVEAGWAAFEKRREDCVAACRALLGSSFRDPEGHSYLARTLARVGETDLATEVLRDVVDRGYLPRAAMDCDPWLAPLLAHPDVPALLRRMDAAVEAARTAFEEAGGPDLLGTD